MLVASRPFTLFRPPVARAFGLLALLAALLPLIQPLALQTPLVVPNLSVPPRPATQAEVAAAPPPATPPAYPLPAELVGRPEVVALRGSHSAVFAMGDGNYAMLQDTEPLHFQDADGQWQPIAPAFAPANGGWLDRLNSVQTSLGLRRGEAKLVAGDVGVAWTPIALQVAHTTGAQVIATPRDGMAARSADGRTVRYTNAWGLPGLAEQWHARRGSSAYSYRLEQLPTTAAAAASLDMAVRLTLLPGTTIRVNGTPAALPLTTDEAVEFVGPSGAPLTLEPPYAYEQGRFEAGVSGSYHLSATADPNVVELLVRVPWAWLAGPARQFPVVVDPRFIVRGPGLWKQIRATYPLTYPVLDPDAPPEKVELIRDRARPAIGTWTALADSAQPEADGKTRVEELAIRFGLPLPPSTQLTSAFLLAAPSAVNNPVDDPRDRDVSARGHEAPVSLHTIQSAGWAIDNALPTYDVAAPLPTVGGPPLMRYSDDRQAQEAVRWDVTDVARSWFSEGGAPSFNSGLLLRTNLSGPCLQVLQSCRLFYFEDDSWADAAQDQHESRILYNSSQPTLPATVSSEQGGLRMLVFYSTRALVPGESIKTLSMGNPALPADNLPPGSRPPFYEAAHVYRLEGLDEAKWYAVAARGQGPSLVEELPDNKVRLTVPAAGATRLGLSQPNAPETGPRPSESAPGAARVSWMLIDGRTQSRDPRWLHLAAASRSNIGTPESGDILVSANSYELVAVTEAGRLTTGTTQATRFTSLSKIPFGTDELLKLWDLELPPASNSMVTVKINSTTIPIEYGEFADHLTARIVSVDANGGLLADAETPAMLVKGAGYGGSSTAFTPGAKNLALVITYDGPNVFTNELPPAPEIVSPDNGSRALLAEQSAQLAANLPPILPELGFLLDISVISCPAGSFPAGGNSCQRVECPASSPQAVDPRERNGLWLWNAAGWSTQGTTFTTIQTDVESQPAPLVGAPNDDTPAVAVVGGLIEYNTATNSLAVRPNGSGGLGDAYLIDCNTSPINAFPVYRGPMGHDTRTINQLGQFVTIPVLEPNGPGQRMGDPWRPDDAPDLQNLDFHVRPTRATANGNVDLRRRLNPGKSTQRDLIFDVGWSFTVNGWLSPTLGNTIAGQAANPQPPDLAGLRLNLGNNFSLDMPPLPPNPSPSLKTTERFFGSVRASNVTVTQPPELGGASRTVQALIMPRGVDIDSEEAIQCPGGSCLDIRNPDDTLAQPNRIWEMPDVRTTGQAATTAFLRDGEALVFSADHPDAALSEGGFNEEFSFEAHKASVSVQQERCVENPNQEGYDPHAPKVTVIRGETRIAVPNIGSSNDPDALIAASFKLCTSTDGGVGLRSVHLEFTSPIGVPIGTTGLFLTGMSGSVDIFPTYTQIRVGVTFQAAQGGNGGLFTASGTVLLDTRGLLEFTGSATILGTVDAQGKLWVAWSPLDIGLEYELSVGNWLSGSMRAHMWQGQGWGNRYDWLPDSKDMHFSGTIQAQIQIPAGAVASIWGLDIPPSDLTLYGYELAFGEFCTSSDCEQYEWGIKGKLVVLGYDVGLYYGFEEGLDFILGNDEHILIDQFNGTNLVSPSLQAARAEGLNVLAAPPVLNNLATLPLAIGPDVEQIMLGLSWMAGGPTLSLRRPDGMVITPANAQQVGAQFASDGDSTLLTVQNPPAGEWEVRIGNLEGNENYTFLYLANSGAPGEAAAASPSRLTTQPAANGRTLISWQVPVDVQPHHTISLFARSTTPLSGTLLQNMPIIKNLPYSQGSYEWDTNGMRNGAYRVYAVVDDGRNQLGVDEISLPDDSCVPLHGPYPRPRAFETGRFPGTEVFTATQTVQVNDTLAPPAPHGLELLPDGNGLLARWRPSLSHQGALSGDVSTYLLRWGPRSGAGFSELGRKEIAASELLTTRIGGLQAGVEYGVSVRALDANNNQSAEAGPVFALAEQPGAPVPFAPIGLTRSGGGSTSVSLSWMPPAGGPAPASYRLTYTRLDGPQPEVATRDVPGSSATLSGLATGGTYEITVSAGNTQGWRSAPSSPLRVVVSNGADGNGDGLPDDWANVFQISLAAVDFDGDGLSNGDEYTLGSSPLLQDSDGDGASDGEEQAAGSDALAANSTSAVLTQPRLSLAEDSLTFRIRPAASPLLALSASAPRSIAVRNAGGGTLKLAADTSDYPWITASVVGGAVQVGVNPAGLAPGFYSGVVRLTQSGPDPLIGKPQCVRVRAWVYPDTADSGVLRLFLPLIRR